MKQINEASVKFADLSPDCLTLLAWPGRLNIMLLSPCSSVLSCHQLTGWHFMQSDLLLLELNKNIARQTYEDSIYKLGEP